ncbi:Guanosine-3',5'-bis(diphosphate) 3'-pyrophosphohydrolase / GTP pyrophosphokinase, (p)ppGpp synthetase II [hydrothermal vent metagenome]|uniref:Guanosine-3',5'-bis(Diphosphate) 3'-pyrophosphohydrolase / GTP pyrophosphokinase, (P)ppGpp synthetase II n=1 Tax=hydrothermal vent metagenome TaxID=652676 RepID=A0A3B0WX68_9ZZZZ
MSKPAKKNKKEVITAGSERFLISDLCDLISQYMDEEQVKDVYHAYLFGAQAHEGQIRVSGEPYIYHPIAVARILAQMHMDVKSIIASILHDVLEDTPATRKLIEHEFGKDVAHLVDGVSKLTHIKFKNKIEQQAENIQKVLLAMAKDIRVIMIKLADRLHNMRTLGALRNDKRRRIAQETLEIYIPIANRLGIFTIRHELENLVFEAIYPLRYRVIKHAVEKAGGHRKELVEKIDQALSSRLTEMSIDFQIASRKKHLFSVYRKMKDKHLPFHKILDVYALRVLGSSVDDCYRILGIVHNLFKPIPGRFKDYIAIPKSNGYQSLHTALYGPHGIPMEVQIRTIDMDKFAESGIAAHWLYKSPDEKGEITAHARTRDWLTGILEMQQSAGDSLEFLENVKVDLFHDEVYVYTPDGDIMKLPRNATPVDFAYAVHTDIGNCCVAAKLDHSFAPLNTPLYSGQTVEIVTSPTSRPNAAWLNYVVTAKARSNIRNYLKNMQADEALSQGQRLVERCLKPLGMRLNDVKEKHLKKVLKDYGFDDLTELLEDVGLGNRPPSLVAKHLVPERISDGDSEETREMKSQSALAISGTEGMVVSYGRCCYPIPGDQVIAKLSKGRGIVVHRDSCKNLEASNKRNHSDKYIDVQWANDASGDFICEIRLEIENKPGLLARTATIISDSDANIENVSMEDRDGFSMNLLYLIKVSDRKHLARVMRRLRRLTSVMRIIRL